jgi:Zn-dependent peptidase ImmA (M78 family)
LSEIYSIPVIVLNKGFDAVRKRFTELHELGHLLLQIPDSASHKEKQAYCHRFAGAMLMPKALFLKELGKRRRHLSVNELLKIKEYYGISLAALVYRAFDLGVISKSTAERFWHIRNSNPDLKQEIGYGIYAGKERSGRFEQLLYKALAEEVISFSKASYLANTSIEQLRNNLQFV